MADENIRKLGAISDEINGNVAVAVRSLQFEDISRQLIEHMQQSLETMLDAFGSFTLIINEAEMSGEENINGVKQGLRDLSEKTAQLHHKPVHQGAMLEGDVELF